MEHIIFGTDKMANKEIIIIGIAGILTLIVIGLVLFFNSPSLKSIFLNKVTPTIGESKVNMNIVDTTKKTTIGSIGAYSSNDFYTELVENKGDLSGGYSIFKLKNPTGVDIPLSKELIGADFRYNNTVILSTDVFILNTTYYSENVTLYNPSCQLHIEANMSTWTDCSKEVARGWYWNNYTTTEYIPLKNVILKSGDTAIIKLVATWKPIIGSVSIDWVPKLTLTKDTTNSTKDTMVIKEDWAWWNVAWTSKAPILIDTVKDETNYQLGINVTYDADMQTDFDDVRFTNGIETTELNYCLNSKVDSSWAFYILKITLTNTNGTQAYVYYGNGAVASTSDCTFLAYNTTNMLTGRTTWPYADSSVTADYAPDGVVDADTTTDLGSWISANTDVSHWVAINFTSEKKIAMIRVFQKLSYQNTNRTLIQASKDGTTWENITDDKTIAAGWENYTLIRDVQFVRLWRASNTAGWVNGGALPNRYEVWEVNTYERIFSTPEPNYTIGSELNYNPNLFTPVIIQWVEIPFYNNTHINISLNVVVINNLSVTLNNVNINVSENYTDYNITTLVSGSSNTHTENKMWSRPVSTDAWFNFTAANITANSTGPSNFIRFIIPVDPPTKAGASTCVYSGSGDWFIDCADNCNLNTDTSVTTNILSFNGTGIIILNATIYSETIFKDPNCIVIKIDNDKAVIW